MMDCSSTLPEPCGHCGGHHLGAGVCPRVKRISYFEDGRIKEVEYHDPEPVYHSPTLTPSYRIQPPLYDQAVLPYTAVELTGTYFAN